MKFLTHDRACAIGTGCTVLRVMTQYRLRVMHLSGGLYCGLVLETPNRAISSSSNPCRPTSAHPATAQPGHPTLPIYSMLTQPCLCFPLSHSHYPHSIELLCYLSTQAYLAAIVLCTHSMLFCIYVSIYVCLHLRLRTRQRTSGKSRQLASAPAARADNWPGLNSTKLPIDTTTTYHPSMSAYAVVLTALLHNQSNSWF